MRKKGQAFNFDTASDANALSCTVKSVNKQDSDVRSPMELHASFMRFISEYETEDRNLALAPLLKIVYEQFCSKFLGGDGIHSATYVLVCSFFLYFFLSLIYTALH